MRIRLIAATAALILTLCDMGLNFRTASAEINQSTIRHHGPERPEFAQFSSFRRWQRHGGKTCGRRYG
jgi:hypothetical protein